MSSVESLQAFLAQDPDNPEIACDLIDLQFAAGNLTSAKTTISQLSPEVQHQPGIRFRMARIDLASGEYQSAQKWLNDLVEQGHNSSAVGHDLAFAALCLRETHAAASIISRTIAQHGATAELHILQARVALMEGDYVQAQFCLDEALRLQPDNATALGLRALGLLDAGDVAGARHAAADCLAQYPDQHEALLAAGTVSLWAADADTAKVHYQRALTRFPNSGRALSGLGQILALSGDLVEAQRVLERGVKAMPDHIGTWHMLGWVQLLQGDLPGASHSYRSAYDLDRNFAESHGGLAVVALLEENFEAGEASMKRALKLDPQCISGRYARTLWLRHQGQVSESDVLFGELMNEGALPRMERMQSSEMAARLRARATSQRPQA